MATDHLKASLALAKQLAAGDGVKRRQWLAMVAASFAVPVSSWSAGLPSAATGSSPAQLAATWQRNAPDSRGFQLGVLAAYSGAMHVVSAIDLPTRAHGLWREAGGALLTVARRPGDWLLRWTPGQAEPSGRVWAEPDRSFNGHVIASADGRTLYTTETHLETGQGLIGVRDAASLQKRAEWPTAGMDPHELLLDVDGSLVVANGGIPAAPETGRLKLHMDRMDSSVVRLDAHTGNLLGQWRLPDRRLSLRHMAWGMADAQGRRTLGIALQAEHDDALARRAASVLALFDGTVLRTVQAPISAALEGYGGDIAFAAGHFAVSCPRANAIGLWDSQGQWQGFAALDEACALASQRAASAAGADATDDGLWIGGRNAALRMDGADAGSRSSVEKLRLDNHWLALA